MAKFSTLKASETPRPAKTSGPLKARMQEYENYVLSVESGEVGALVAEGNETPRSVSMRVSRAGARTGETVETWIVDGTVYFSKEKRRGRQRRSTS